MRFVAPFFVLGALVIAQSKPAGTMVKPQYTPDGALIRPQDFAQWTFVGASLGLSYSENARNDGGPGTFHNVQMQPEAYQEYKKTGKFPEKTIFVLTLHEPEQRVSPSQHGYFEGKLLTQEVAVKDKERFPEGWAYFDFGGGANLRETAKAQAKDRCFACHVKHGQDDNVFVQFYPALRK